MRKKLLGYTLLSLSSFFFFFTVFHTTANAEGSSGIFAPLLSEISKPPSPTPTNIPPTPTNTPTPTGTPIPTPTPLRQGFEGQANTPTPTSVPTNTPTPTETPIPSETITPQATQPTESDLDAWFTKYADDYHTDRELLRRIAACESGFNTNANYKDMYLGMYQFGESAWIGARSRMGLDTNPALRTNAEEAIRTAAYKLSQGEQGAWPNCN